MAVVLTIGGVTKTLKRGSLTISMTANGRSTARFVIESATGSYRPALDAEVIITEGGTRIFGGLIDKPSEEGIFDGGKAAIATAINAVDFAGFADRKWIGLPFPAQTLKQRLQAIVDGYLADFSVTLHGSQVDGPSLPAVDYNLTKASDVLNQTITLTAKYGEQYMWTIDHFRVLRATQPSTVAAPFDIADPLPIAQVLGDITVESTRQRYFNRVFIVVATQNETGRTETFAGDGTTNSFTPQYTVTNLSRGVVNVDGVDETLTTTDFAGSATWTYDTTTNTITRETGAPANGAVISFSFDGTYSAVAQAEDAAEIALYGPYEDVKVIEKVPDDTTVQAFADAYLAQSLAVATKITYRTLETGILPGMTQTFTVARRNLSVDAVVTDVTIRDFLKTQLVREVSAVAGAETNRDRGFRDVYKEWMGDKTGGGHKGNPTTIGPIAPSLGAPAPPLKSVQFNRNGKFGGNASFTYEEDQTSVLIGLGHSVYGFDNLIVGSNHTVGQS